jgi:cellulose synthase/poly-beta-1,6-N-acetylglucosamine synthase-like glycosyltransferase
MQQYRAESAKAASAQNSDGRPKSIMESSIPFSKLFSAPRRVLDDRIAGLSVFLPCHNEEGNIQSVVEAIEAELQRIPVQHEIVVVNDGSRDRTGEIADRLAAANPNVKVVHHPINLGYGGAVISGIHACTQPWVVLCDGDGQFVASDIGKLVNKTPDYDAVVGRRAHRADPLMRRVNGRAWTLLMELLLGIRISDLDCGLKLFRRDLLEGVDLQAKGAMISAELMAQLAGRGANICEVEVQHLPRLNGEQSGASMRVILRAFKELFLLCGRLRQARRP